MHSDLKVNIFPFENAGTNLRYVVITSKYNNQWLFVRNRERITWEIPGGHIEPNESPDEAAARELKEETGAEIFNIKPIADYSVEKDSKITFGRLYFAEIEVLGKLPDSEIAEITHADQLPPDLTYPLIQPILFRFISRSIQE